jgi:hypothetical protein
MDKEATTKAVTIKVAMAKVDIIKVATGKADMEEDMVIKAAMVIKVGMAIRVVMEVKVVMVIKVGMDRWDLIQTKDGVHQVITHGVRQTMEVGEVAA